VARWLTSRQTDTQTRQHFDQLMRKAHPTELKMLIITDYKPWLKKHLIFTF